MNLKYQPVSLSIDTQKTKDSNFKKLYYNIKLNLINDEGASVNIKYIELDAFVNGNKIGTVKNTQGFEIPARSSKIINLETSFGSANVLLLIADLIINGFDTELSTSGFVQTDLGRININFKM